MANSDAAESIMDALDDLLNDLNAVTRELGFDTSPSEPASSTSLTSEKSSVSAESGLGLSNDLSSDFQPSKKVSPPKLLKQESPSQKSDYSEGTYNDGLDQIMNSLTSWGDISEKPKEPEKTSELPKPSAAPEMVNRLATTPPKVQTAKRVSFRSSVEIEESEFTASPRKQVGITDIGKLPKPGLPPQMIRSAGASPQKPPVRPRMQQILPRPPNTPKASVSSTGSSDSLKMPPPPPKFPPPALTPPVSGTSTEKVTLDGAEQQRIPPFAETATIMRNRQYLPLEKDNQQVPSQHTQPITRPMNPDVNNFMEKIKGVAVLASDQSSDGDDVDPLPPFVSLSYSAGHNVVPDKKSSPAVSVNTDFSRDSGFSTDTTFPSPPQQLKPACPYEADEHVRIFSGEGSYKLIPIEKGMSVRYITQLMAEKHRVKLTAKHSLLEYNPELATERILEDHENVCEVILERKQAQGQPSREERHKILQKWFPDRGGFNYPGFDGHSVVRDTIFYKNDTKDKWTKKYIELRGHKLLIFKKESAREKVPEEIVDLHGMLLHRGVEWKTKFKAPLSNGFAIRHPKVTKMNKSNNPDGRIRFFAAEDQLDELKWITALRLAKLGLKMIENYRNTISTVERPSSLLSLRPPSFGPLPLSNSRPNSLETLQVDGLQPSPKKPVPPSMPPSGHVHKAIFHQPPGQPVPHSKPRPAHQTQSTLNRPPPMTNFYDSPRAENHGPPSPLRRGDFPPPPPFISQIKQLTTQVYEQGNQSRGIGFDLPPPPPELMIQAARSSKRRNPNTRLNH
ncbi:unnamed protein product [Oikopleura dioica]|uniref:PH domain-containing protein n=1 Tax=Oikopleura dioica TaxID=34765 RepID=E4YQM0_OIKDI|nr:unnamed protein product [Oikopleura dioica]